MDEQARYHTKVSCQMITIRPNYFFMICEEHSRAKFAAGANFACLVGISQLPYLLTLLRKGFIIINYEV